jgi:hypothetical protein
MQSESPKFVGTMAKIYIRKSIQKPFIGKPYIMAGAFWGACGYLFQQCGLLGRLYTKTPLPFMRVLAAQEGKEDTALAFLESAVNEEIIPYLSDETTFTDLVYMREMARMNSSDDPADFFLKHGQEKLSPDGASTLAAEWAAYGGCMGLKYPSIISDLFKSTNKPSEPEEWARAYKAGVVDTPEQTVISIEAAESEVTQIFREYCVEFYPELLPALFP